MTTEDDEKEIEASKAPLMTHLIELRSRLIKALAAFFLAAVFCFFFAKQLFNILVQPFKWAVQWAGMDHKQVELIYTAPQEFFFTQMNVALFGALFLGFPFVAAQIYAFVAPGLYKKERNAFVGASVGAYPTR